MALCENCICYDSCADWADQYEDTEFPYGYCTCYKPKDNFAEVVRCKDCKACDVIYPVKNIGEDSIEAYFCIACQTYRQPTDFCSYGKRKEK